jgi:hypothetical protein
LANNKHFGRFEVSVSLQILKIFNLLSDFTSIKLSLASRFGSWLMSRLWKGRTNFPSDLEFEVVRAVIVKCTIFVL